MPPKQFKALRDLGPREKNKWLYNFLRRAPPQALFPGTWRGGRLLGEGGFGAAAVWLQVDANNNITDRVVIKEAKMNRKSYDNFDNYNSNPLPEDKVKNRQPREVYLMKCLRPTVAGGRDHILRLREYKKISSEKQWRIYTDFADRGDLQGVLLTHIGWNDRVQRRVHQPPNIPEAFLWYAFESLAIAAQTMERPPNLPAGHTFPQDSQIIHLDLKPQNVFLAAPHPTYFRHYPQVKVGDFGSGRITDANDPDNPNHYRRMSPATEGYQSPEHFADVLPSGALMHQPLHRAGAVHSAYRILAKNNVWQIGRIMLSLMMLDPVPAQVDYYNVPRNHMVGYPQGNDPWFPPFNIPANYSAALEWLVKDCLEISPAMRPTPTQLFAHCRATINNHYRIARDRVAPYGYEDVDRLWNKTAYEDDLFAVGKTADTITHAPTVVYGD